MLSSRKSERLAKLLGYELVRLEQRPRHWYIKNLVSQKTYNSTFMRARNAMSRCVRVVIYEGDAGNIDFADKKTREILLSTYTHFLERHDGKHTCKCCPHTMKDRRAEFVALYKDYLTGYPF